MKMGEVPPTPGHVADMIDKKLVKSGMVPKKYASTMTLFFNLQKKITHREIQKISGREYDDYKAQAVDFLNVMRKVVESK